jgi:four helix bundle protein
LEQAPHRERPHERLDVWRDAMDLAVAAYAFTSGIPDSERYGLVAQIRRAAVSIPSNIAEGAARRSTADYLRFLGIARGSAAELDTQVQLSERLWPTNSGQALRACTDRTFARLNALIAALERRVSDEGPAYVPCPAVPESLISNPESHAPR